MPKLKLGELFAGYGGLGLAIEEAFGAELAWYAEFDKAPSKIMAQHWPDLTNYGDVTAVDWANVPHVDIIGGGSPCQDLSLAGARKGMSDGTRSNLWESMREAIATIKPTYVAWENVRGALSAKATSVSDMGQREGFLGERGGHLRALGRVLGDLADLGYDTQWRGLRAADVGAPHGRFRVFILATRRAAIADPAGIGRHEAIQRHGSGAQTFDGAGVPHESDRDAMRARPIGEAVADAGGEASRKRAGLRESEPERIWRGRPDNHPSPAATHAGLHGRNRSQELDGKPEAHGEEGASWGHALGRGLEDDGASANWGPYAPAIRRWEAVRGTAPAPTELTPKGKHRLSARFAEWMMGVDPGWVTDVDISRNEQLKAIGNGVVPQQAVAAIKEMLGVLPNDQK